MVPWFWTTRLRYILFQCEIPVCLLLSILFISVASTPSSSPQAIFFYLHSSSLTPQPLSTTLEPSSPLPSRLPCLHSVDTIQPHHQHSLRPCGCYSSLTDSYIPCTERLNTPTANTPPSISEENFIIQLNLAQLPPPLSLFCVFNLAL
ncbi:hypothetical protein K457DRAFT_1468394 [Linnemannia elongata AG-77]|uniref:Uncharacterized protein n=1 Tax=Linnemannia elongata AG-77 TaxID=1314771 RepID=A0A197JTA7_9FUNG|nr:hypothetical protein K457DRAFT_1468394 [Linnemannia elongata AG-77]